MQANALTRAVPALAFAGALAAGSMSAQARDVPATFAPVAKELLPAVVNISTTRTVEGEEGGPFAQLPPDHPLREFFKGLPGTPERQRQLRSLGSGFIVDGDGTIVTNHHVIREADSVTVILHDDTRLEAEVVGVDPKTDLAVLDVDTERQLTAARWGDSETAEIGDWVLAIGNPFGLGGSLTAGIVSARGRDINAGPYSRFIQTDTAINRGNSGGPLFNLDGEVIGVNTAILSPSGGNVGVGFALPARVAQPIIEELRRDGEVTRGWLGVSVQPVTEDLAKGLDLPGRKGALVGSVLEGGPAAEAGLEQGDVILELDGRAIEDASALAWMVSQRDPGEAVELTLWRDGGKRTQSVKLGRLADARTAARAPAEGDPERVVAKRLGLRLAPPVPQVKEKFDLPADAQGAVVVGVARGGPAASRGIRPGDVITQIGRQKVADPEAAAQAVVEALKQGADGAIVLVRRGNQSRFVSLPFAGAGTG